MKEVHHELVMLPFLSVFDNLEYRVDGGTVTLMGQVVNSALKDDAASAVKHIEGVESVDNQIRYFPPRPWTNRSGVLNIGPSIRLPIFRCMQYKAWRRSI